MIKSRAVYIVGPRGMRDLPRKLAEFEICAVADPTARHPTCGATGLRVYRSAHEAMRCTGASSLIYGDSYIDVNGFGALRVAEALEFDR